MTKKQFERFLICRNETQAHFIKSCISNLKPRLDAIEQTLRKYGLPVTDGTVGDALRIKLTHEAGEPLQQGNFTHKICVAVEVWLNAKHLDEAFDEIKSEMLAKVGNISLTHEQVISQIALAKQDCYERLQQYSTFRTREDVKNAVIYSICVNGEGHIAIDDTKLDAYLDETFGIWCESPEAEIIYEVHKAAARALNKFMSYIPDMDLEGLFYMKDGKWTPNVFNYNNFIKEV